MTEQEIGRRQEFRRMVVISAAVHLLGLGLAVSQPAPRRVALPQVISIELVPDPGKPTEKVRPSAPKPKPRKPKKIVLPAKPREPVPAREAAKKPERRKEVFLDEAPKEEKSLEDLLADFRQEQGEQESPAPPPSPLQTAVASTPGATTGIQISPEVAMAIWHPASIFRIIPTTTKPNPPKVRDGKPQVFDSDVRFWPKADLPVGSTWTAY